MGNENGAQTDGIRQSTLSEAADKFAEAEACVNKDAFASAMDDGGVAGTAASEYRHADMCCICFEHILFKMDVVAMIIQN
jgi:hypothetical protein